MTRLDYNRVPKKFDEELLFSTFLYSDEENIQTTSEDYRYTVPYVARHNNHFLKTYVKNVKTNGQKGAKEYCLPVEKNKYKDVFNALVSEWREDTAFISSVQEMFMHPAYQQIIGMGYDAIPLILKELEQNREHWFWALKMITRVDPVPESAVGNVKEMAKCWLGWGKGEGYIG